MSLSTMHTHVTPANPNMVSAVSYKPQGPLLARELSDEELALFIANGKRREHKPREVIFHRGELGRSMFVIETGKVLLEFGDGMPDKVIGASEFFGELALFIGNHARMAHAIADSACVLHMVEHAAFEELLKNEPQLLANFMRRSFSYLVASEQQLIASLKRRNEDLLVTLNSLRQTQNQLSTAERLIQTDELTCLCNRRGLYQFIERLNERKPDTMFGVLLVDVDNFKQINDRNGHLVGDNVLRAVAQELLNLAVSCDLPCRLGGDEFALLAKINSLDELKTRAMQIVTAVRALRFAKPQEELRVTVSIGGAVYEHGGQWSMWYGEADSALYNVKSEGGDSWKILS